MKIEILDSIECEISKRDGAVLAPALSFESSYWVQGPLKKSRKVYKKNVFSFKGKQVWRFYTGLLPRVLEYCEENGIPVEVIGEELKIKPQKKPHLAGITFRDDQLKLIDAACKAGRGVIQAPTGVGKTIIQLGIISCYPKHRILVLVHNKDIVLQTFKKLKSFGFKDIEMYGAGNRAKEPTARIAVATMQTFVKIKPEDYMDYYDIILLDESHHAQKMDSTYVKILSHLLAPVKIGFTATKRTNGEAVLINEGLFGKTIDRVTIKEASDLGILATPKGKLIKAKCSDEILDIRNFQDSYEKIRVEGKLVNGARIKVGVYTYGIVENEKRNRQIAKIVKDFYEHDRTTLIFVTHINHGNLIAKEIKKELSVNVPFVQGSMDAKDREKTKSDLINKKLKVCIASSTWIEGVDVPNLDCVIMAGGGKSDIQTLQKIGRGLRKTKDKDFVTIVDFLDLKHFHLIRQTGERLSTYSDNNWL